MYVDENVPDEEIVNELIKNYSEHDIKLEYLIQKIPELEGRQINSWTKLVYTHSLDRDIVEIGVNNKILRKTENPNEYLAEYDPNNVLTEPQISKSGRVLDVYKLLWILKHETAEYMRRKKRRRKNGEPSDSDSE